MDPTQAISKLIDNGGLVAILIILIWRLPQTINAFNQGVQYIMGQVRAVQDETLKAHNTHIEQMFEERKEERKETNARFEAIEGTLKEMSKTLASVGYALQQLLSKQE